MVNKTSTCFSLLLLLASLLLATAARTSVVRNEQELIKALRNHAVTDVLLTQSIQLTPKKWPGSPSILLRRDVTIRAASFVVLDAAWLPQKLALDQGRTLRLERLVLRRLVTHGESGSDFIIYSNKALVSIRSCVHEMLICPTDLSMMLEYLRKLPRPADRSAGAQQVELMDHMDCLATPWQQHCQPAGVLLSNVALAASSNPTDSRLPAGQGPVVEYASTYLPCSAYLSPTCVEKYGLAACYDSMLSKLAWQQWLEQHLVDLVVGVVIILISVVALQQWAGQPLLRPVGSAAHSWWAAQGSTAHSSSSGSTAPFVSGSSTARKGIASTATSAAYLSTKQVSGTAGGGTAEEFSHTSSTVSRSTASRLAPGFAVNELVYGSLLGTGSFGRVYSGTWGGERVAIKVMEVETSDKYVANEVRISHMLDHPNIVRCLHHEFRPMGSEREADMDATGVQRSRSGSLVRREKGWTQVLMVLEFCDAGSLSDAIKDGSFVVGINRIPDMDTVLQLALDVARGMAYMHEQQLCHGDLASKNVLLHTCKDSSARGGKRVVAKVADFGLSRWLPHHAAALNTMTCGTVTHQAPELLNHHQLSLACDVYSFGIILWELVHPDACAVYGTGLSASPWAVAQHIMAGGRPQFYTQCVPDPYKELAKLCWDADPQKRPTFKTIVQQLELVITQSVGDATSFVQEFF